MKRGAIPNLIAFAFLIFPMSGLAAVTSMFGYSQTKILYSQDQSPDLNYWMHTLKAGVEITKDDSRWAYGLSGYAALEPSFTYPGDNSYLRFFGGNLRVAYSLISKKRFQLSLAAGYYYVTSLANSYSGGFENLNGPQIYPSFRYKLKKAGLITGYAKYSPVSSKFEILSIKGNYELAAGLTYFFKQQFFPFSLGLSFDFSEIRFSASSGITSALKTASAGFTILL
ncbi:MAG: hypothetical protein KGP28_06140 [Bdellovibrionales bacterium]|nr:hypothetical protein [Bdellovibrionales bacterium]